MTDPSLSPIVFAYNFPHKKTEDFLLRLLALGARPELVLLADPVRLNIPPAPVRVKPRHVVTTHPAELCKRFGVPFEVVDHKSARCLRLLEEREPALGIVSGARILPPTVIERFTIGVMNFHPGLIPEVRGLDALQWAIHYGLPLGVTAHLIDHRVDAGRVVERRTIQEYPDDTLIDLSLRLYETQVDMLRTTLQAVATTPADVFPKIRGGEYRRSFPAEFAAGLQDKLERRLGQLQAAA